MMSKTRVIILVLIALAIIGIDIASKFATTKYIIYTDNRLNFSYPYGGIPIFKDFMGIEFSLGHVHNKGAAWGVLAEYSNTLLVMRCVSVVAIILYLVFFNKVRSYDLPLILIIAGAIGNILDFLIYGSVIDMFHFNFWGYDYPLFNIADSSIFIGVVCFFALSLFSKKNDTLPRSQ